MIRWRKMYKKHVFYENKINKKFVYNFQLHIGAEHRRMNNFAIQTFVVSILVSKKSAKNEKNHWFWGIYFTP